MDAISRDIARRTSIFSLLSLIVLMIALAPAKTFGQDNATQLSDQPTQLSDKTQDEPKETNKSTGDNASAPANVGVKQTERNVSSAQSGQISDEKSPLSSGALTVFLGAVAVFGLLLFCLIAGVGAGATVIALLRNAPEKQSEPVRLTHRSWRPFAQGVFHQWALKTEQFVRLHFDPSRWKPQRMVQGVGQSAKGWFVRFLPSRRTAFRLGCVALGAALMVLSVFLIIKVENWYGKLVGFLPLLIGYAIIVAVWMWPWTRRDAAGDGPVDTEMAWETIQTPGDRVHPAVDKVPAPNILTVQHNRVEQELAATTIDFGPSAATSQHHSVGDAVPPAIDPGLSTSADWHSVGGGPSESQPATVEPSRGLYCAKCETQFRVRGQGELDVRLIPCPHCGAALRKYGDQPRNVPQEPTWAPIISVHCGHCHGLIDVPYSSIGKTISCPRCYADLPVPDAELGDFGS